MPPSPKLAPFGIRDLHGPAFHPGVVQLSAREYNDTLKSQPDAALLYVDEDDGEQITVGSGFELGQRLEEPVYLRMVDDAPKPVRSPIDGTCLHIFDINWSPGSVAVWRDHEAYSSKHMRLASTTPVKSADSDAPIRPEYSQADLSPVALESLGRTSILRYDGATQDLDTLKRLFTEYGTLKDLTFVQDKTNSASGWVEFGDWTEAEIAKCALDGRHGLSISRQHPDDPVTSSLSFDEPSLPSDTATAITEEITRAPTDQDSFRLDTNTILQGIEQHLSGLASVLSIAATTLQKAADKTKDTDTSVAEDVLAGVKNILSEVGNFGRDALKALESEAVSIDRDVQNPSVDEVPVADTNGSILHEEPLAEHPPKVKFALDDSTADLRPVRPLRSAASTPALRAFKLDLDAESDSETNPFASPTSLKAESILDGDDEDAEDAEFTARYPPLMTVRRSQTVAGSAQRPRYQPYSRRYHSPESARPLLAPSVKSADVIDVKKAVADDNNLADSIHHSLPGAWPDARPDPLGPGLPTSNESSGSFFNRMTGRFDAEPSLRRTKTTAAANPASRLNGPFDPGFAYHSKPPARTQDTPKGTENGDELARHLKRSRSDAPRYRPLRPVWTQTGTPFHGTSSPSSKLPKTRFEPWNPPSPPVCPVPQPRNHLEPFPPTFWRAPPPPRSFPPPPPPPPPRAVPRHHYSVPNFGPLLHHPSPPSPAHSSVHIRAPVPFVPQPPTFSDWPALVPQPAPISASPPLQTPSAEPVTILEPSSPISKYETCVEQLKAMGFDRKINGEDVANRLHVYAVAADGDVSEAVEMINEDREAVKRFSVPSSADYRIDIDSD